MRTFTNDPSSWPGVARKLTGTWGFLAAIFQGSPLAKEFVMTWRARGLFAPHADTHALRLENNTRDKRSEGEWQMLRMR